jgi:hypothetical protein
MPMTMVLRRAAATNWPKLCAGLPMLTAPTIAPSRFRGAATYITAVVASWTRSGVVRAPYLSSSASLMSRQRE